MPVFRALAYFVQEALTSLWRSRLINALSIGTIGVSLFVLGAFLTVASNLNAVVTRWTQKIQVTFYMEDGKRRANLAGVGRPLSSASRRSSTTCGRCPTTSARTRFPSRSR